MKTIYAEWAKEFRSLLDILKASPGYQDHKDSIQRLMKLANQVEGIGDKTLQSVVSTSKYDDVLQIIRSLRDNPQLSKNVLRMISSFRFLMLMGHLGMQLTKWKVLSH